MSRNKQRQSLVAFVVVAASLFRFLCLSLSHLLLLFPSSCHAFYSPPRRQPRRQHSLMPLPVSQYTPTRQWQPQHSWKDHNNNYRYYYYCANNKPHFWLLHSSPDHWPGDDIRWSTRLSRRFFRRRNKNFKNLLHRRHTGRNLLVLLNCAAFLYQVITTVQAIRRRHAAYWPTQGWTMVADAVWGSSTILGSFTKAFVHSTILSRQQPHRYLTSGFLHGGLLHLLLNMHALLRGLPSWLETGLGTPLYVTTYLVSIVMGNAAHSWFEHDSITSIRSSMCLGASGGITGLYGLMYVCLVRMGNQSAATQVLKGIVLLFLYGIVLDSISNAAHIGGFVGGLLVGVLCGPSYAKSYTMRRKWSLEVDNASRDYRLAMGFGTKPSNRGLIPLPVLWAGIVLGILLAQPKWRAAPRLVWQGILHPSSVPALGI